MPGLVPGIHVLLYLPKKDVDGRDKPGHDEQMPGAFSMRLSEVLLRFARKCGCASLLRQNNPTGKSVTGLSSPFAKNIPLRNSTKSLLYRRRPASPEGRFAIVTDVRRDAMDASGAAKTRALFRGRRSRVVLMPRRWHQVGGKCPADEGGKKARSPGRARRKPLKPLRRESRMFPVEPVVLPPCFFCTGPTGAIGTRLSLRPLNEEGGTNRPNLARNMRRDREGAWIFTECEHTTLRRRPCESRDP